MNISQLPWIEKYRPKNMSEISAQEETVQVLKKSITSKNLPHLLFYGPPGTGKTSSILALARELYGTDKISSRVLELNASDERGIAVIREKVKNFAKISIGNSFSNGSGPPYKIIILDEADSLTSDAQSALRRIMENYSKVTRFCLICNYVTRIIEPLASRCAKFRFKPIAFDLCLERIEFICQQEGMKYDKEALIRLISLCKGDLRRAIMLLQCSYQYCIEDKLDLKQVDEIAGVIPNDILHSLLDTALSKDSNAIINKTRDVVADGYPLDTIIQQLNEAILDNTHLDNLQKAKIGISLAKADANCALGGDELLNVLDLMFAIAKVIEK